MLDGIRALAVRVQGLCKTAVPRIVEAMNLVLGFNSFDGD